MSILWETTVADHSPVDQADRDRIRADRDRTLFVEAGAGSGKTRALVDRVEALVIDDAIPLENIAAITFTEKAAAELRDRIRQRFEAHVASPAHPTAADAARVALHQLDGAPIGTLHSFAQRILTEHPVEAGLPPGVDVLDEIGSQIDFEQRWRVFLDELLDDDAMARTLLVLEAAGVRLDALRTLTLQMVANWDLVEERLDFDAPRPGPFPRDELLRVFDAVEAYADSCDNPDDKLLARFPDVRHHRALIAGALDDIEALELAHDMGDRGEGRRRIRVGNAGNKGNWRIDVVDVRNAFSDLRAACDQAVSSVTTAALAHVAARIGRFVLHAAEERRTVGRLDFHDLLVRARRLLRDRAHGPEVRAALAERYPRLLLDEFQDTDPIQVELATLIATDDPDVGDKDWTDLTIRPGALFFVGDPKQSIYRFRRADIGVFLTTRERVADRPALTVNFRTTAPIIEWVNHVFGQLIHFTPDSQPEYVSLSAHRTDTAPFGPAVAVLGADPFPGKPTAEELRACESRDVAGAIITMLDERAPWQVEEHGVWRDARASDICILLPARTTLPALETALTEAGVPYRAETSSLVYATREVRELLLTLTAIADPTDELATVAALRSFVYGCGDDDLAHWRLGLHGRFTLRDPIVEANVDHPVAAGLRHMQQLHDARLWSTPAELLDRLVRERGVLESVVATGSPRDVWRRLRFVVDQARAWVDAGGTDLRAYLQWARLQGADNARVSETVLPETDDDSVRIMTIHGAKGLEFPITVLAGMTTRTNNSPRGPSISFPPTGEVALRLSSSVTSASYDAWAAIDEQMAEHERLRLLYVAATRARDHLVVCLHRHETETRTGAALLADHALTTAVTTPLEPSGGSRRSPGPILPTPIPPRHEWLATRNDALDRASTRSVVSATTLAREAAEAGDPGLDKRARDLDLPPWQKGRYGTAVGRAVHAVLQVVDLATGEGLEAAATAQAAAEGVINRTDVITALARQAVESELAQQACSGEFWRELWVAAPVGDKLIEGYVDLLYRTADGLVIVDWKTDHVAGDDDVQTKLARYRLQGASYAAAVEVATGETVSRVVFAFLHEAGVVEAEVIDLPAAVAEVRARAAELADASATIETLTQLR